MQLADLLDDFERSLRRRDLSPCTVNAYHWALRDLIEKAMRPARLTDVNALTRTVLEEWQDTQLERGWVPRTRGLAATAVRQFIRFGIEKDLIVDPKLERALAKIKQPDPEPHPIPEADLGLIKAHLLPVPESASVAELRDRALFFFILATGGRVSEILQTRVNDYEAPNVIQKGGTRKTLGVPAEASALIRDYLAARTDDRPELWVSFKARSFLRLMTPGQVREVWHAMSAKLALGYWTTHAIRHTCATELLAAEIPHLVIAEHLGHHGVATISNYAKVRDKGRAKVLGVMGGLMRTEAA
jgi:integrase/recombinase XerD